jgi:hypothetical protein
MADINTERVLYHLSHRCNKFAFPLIKRSREAEVCCSVLQVGEWSASHKSIEVTNWQYS